MYIYKPMYLVELVAWFCCLSVSVHICSRLWKHLICLFTAQILTLQLKSQNKLISQRRRKTSWQSECD